jgi:hypothetical protein
MSRASVEDLPPAPPASMAALSLNGPPAGAALPGPGPVGPASHMSAGYAPESLEDQLEGVDLRSDADNRHQAVIHVEWKGSAEEFAGAGSTAQRTVNIGSFGETWVELDSEDRPVDRKRAVILGVTARAVNNTFPITVAAKWTGGAGNLNQLSTRRGRVAAVLAHKESSRGSHALYTPSDSVSTRHFRQYAHHTTESLRKDIVKFPHGFSYVPINSPIVQIMAKNRDTLCVDLNEADMRESNYCEWRAPHAPTPPTPPQSGWTRPSWTACSTSWCVHVARAPQAVGSFFRRTARSCRSCPLWTSTSSASRSTARTVSRGTARRARRSKAPARIRSTRP